MIWRDHFVCGYTTLIYQMGNPFSVAVGETTRRPIAYIHDGYYMGRRLSCFCVWGLTLGDYWGGGGKKGELNARTHLRLLISFLRIRRAEEEAPRLRVWVSVGLCVCRSVGR